jgi:hypothetical protein
MCEVSAKIGTGVPMNLGSQTAMRNRVFSHGLIQEQTFARTPSPTAHCVADHVRCMGRSDRS